MSMQKCEMFVYKVPPVDYAFGMVSFASYFSCVGLFYENSPLEDERREWNTRILMLLMSAASVAGTRWDGSLRSNDSICVFSSPVPDMCNLSLGVMWKQDNNGTTFIASEHPVNTIDDKYMIYPVNGGGEHAST